MCEERVRRKVLASSCASREDDTQTKVGREVKEKMKTVKRGDGCDVRSIEEIKAEITLVERQLREKRREEEEDQHWCEVKGVESHVLTCPSSKA